ncbi:MAG: septum site-determining protein MinC [Methylococcaceae bacterium]|nr:MAG: septum site-determining protein MinC [Methylococcaceae bacterium]
MTPKSPPKKSAIELRSGSLTVPVLRLLSADLGLIAEQLAQKIDQAPEFFRNAPLMMELSEAAGEPDFPALLGKLRALGVQPIGVRGGSEQQHHLAQAAGLVIFAEGRSEPQPAPQPAGGTTVQYVEMHSKVVTLPVRSGQQIYAQGGDLIVLAPVSVGAELIADGNIHVYGSLRGRALAGVKGDVNSRIFCKDLQAELVSIAGNYRISENLDASVIGKAVQIYLKGEALMIETLFPEIPI